MRRVQSARWLWPSSPVPPCCPRVWCVAGLALATRLILLSAEAGLSAVCFWPSGLRDSSCRLVMVPASFDWTCGHWVGCGPCIISWPQPAATGWGSGSHPSWCIAPRLLWWWSFFLGRWCCCADSLVCVSHLCPPSMLCRQLYWCLVCVSHLCPSCCAVSCIVAWYCVSYLCPFCCADSCIVACLCVLSMSFLLCRQLYCCLVCVSHLCPPSCCADSCIVAWFVCLICVLPVVQTAVLLPGLCVSSMSFLLCRQLYHCLVCVSHLCPSCCADSCIIVWFVCLIYVLPVVQTAVSLSGLCVSSMSFLLCRQLYHCLVCVFQKVQPCWPFPPTACERSVTPSCRCCTSCTRLFLSHRYSLSSCSLDHFIISITQVHHFIVFTTHVQPCLLLTIISTSSSHRRITSLSSPHSVSLHHLHHTVYHFIIFTTQCITSSSSPHSISLHRLHHTVYHFIVFTTQCITSSSSPHSVSLHRLHHTVYHFIVFTTQCITSSSSPHSVSLHRLHHTVYHFIVFTTQCITSSSSPHSVSLHRLHHTVYHFIVFTTQCITSSSSPHRYSLKKNEAQSSCVDSTHEGT